MAAASHQSHFERDGFLVLPGFVPTEQCDALRARMAAMLEAFAPAAVATIFSTGALSHAQDRYFLESGDRIRFFFEEEAFDESGRLKQSKARSINKVGHALHDLDPVFERFSRQPALAGLVAELGIAEPLLLQSMYIFKQPRIGGEVGLHQDASFLMSEPPSVVGLWFALEDASCENGCLQAAPGDHKGPLRCRFVRHDIGGPHDRTAMITLDPAPLPSEGLVPLEVRKGTLVVLHGLCRMAAPRTGRRTRAMPTRCTSSTLGAPTGLTTGCSARRRCPCAASERADRERPEPIAVAIAPPKDQFLMREAGSDKGLTMLSAPSAADGSAGDPDDHADDIIYPSAIPFLLVHLACFAAIWTGLTAEALLLGGALYVVRMFAVTAGYHRYFAHRTYQTSRVAQFLLAFLAQTSSQRGVLWWAANHRAHHRHADTLDDVHSPRLHGFWRAHVGWIFTPRRDRTDYEAIADFTRYPELVWLDRLPYLPPALLALATWLVAGWPGLIVGFCWSTVLVWHATFAINSVAHVAGRRRYVTGDDSRNNWWLAILTMGEGWHNNHHAYQSSVRQGFRWWEYDPTFYALKALSWLGIVWNLHSPPAAVIRGEQRLGRKVIEKAAHQLAFAFPHDRIAALTREELDRTARWEELQERLGEARSQAAILLSELHLPHVPSVDELRRYAEQHLARTPSLEEIVARARQILLESISVRLLASAAPVG